MRREKTGEEKTAVKNAVRDNSIHEPKAEEKPAWRKAAGTAAFLGIALLLFVMLSYFVRPSGSGNYRTIFPGFYAMEKNSLDVVALGSSSVYRFVDNPYLWEAGGITSYDLATGAMPVSSYKYLVREVEKTQTPQLYIVGTRAYLNIAQEQDLKDIRLRRVTDNMNYSLTRAKMITDIRGGLKGSLPFLFDFYVYHGNWENKGTADLAYLDNIQERWMKGWNTIFRIKEIEPIKTWPGLEEKALTEEAEKELIDFLEDCKANGRNVLFLETPWKRGRKRAAQTLAIGRIVESYGYRFLDMNTCLEEIGLDYTMDFYNSHHVNTFGARKVTAYLAGYLEREFDLGKSHTRELIQEWDALTQEADRIVEENLEAVRLQKQE